MLPEISCWAFSFSLVSSAFRGIHIGIGDLQNRLFLPYAAVVLLFLMHSSHDRPPLRVSCLPSFPARCTRNDVLTSSLLSSVMPRVCASPWTLLLNASSRSTGAVRGVRALQGVGAPNMRHVQRSRARLHFLVPIMLSCGAGREPTGVRVVVSQLFDLPPDDDKIEGRVPL